MDYIRDNVPYLNKNTAAAVALVEAGATTISDAARITGRSRSGVGEAVAVSAGKPADTKPGMSKEESDAIQAAAKRYMDRLAATQQKIADQRAKTLTGKTAPGPAIGTKKKEKPTTMTPLAGVTPPVTPTASPMVTEAINLLKQVADLDISAIRMATTAHQYRRLNKAAARAEKVAHELSLPMLTL